MSNAELRIRGRHPTPSFYITIAAVMTLVVFFGFERTFFLSPFYDEPHPLAPSEPIFYIHGAIVTLWMAFIILQPTLIRFGRYSAHRTLGWFGVGIAVLTVITGLWGALVGAARPGGFLGPPVPPLEFLAIIGFNMIMYGALVGAAAGYRGRGNYHKRLMLLATINLLQAAVVRIPVDFIENGPPLLSFQLPYIFVVGLIVWDWATLRNIHPATLWGGLAIILSLPARLWIAETEAWLSIAKWAVQLVQ